MQQDRLMRQIEMMVSMILRLLDIEPSQDSALPEELRQSGSGGLEPPVKRCGLELPGLWELPSALSDP